MLRNSLLALLIFLIPQALLGQGDPLAEARVAWAEGQYLDALDEIERALTEDAHENLVREAALLTGEWYHSVELAPDGRDPVWAPDSRHLAFIIPGAGAVRLVDTGVRTGAPAPVADVEGSAVVFHPTEAVVAVTRLREREKLDSALQEARGSIEARDFASRTRLSRELERIEAEFTSAYLRDLADGNETAFDTEGLGVRQLLFAPDGTLMARAHLVGSPDQVGLYLLAGDQPPVALLEGPSLTQEPLFARGGELLVWPHAGGVILAAPEGGVVAEFEGATGAVASTDGNTLAFLTKDGDATVIQTVDLTGPATARELYRSQSQVADLTLAPDGSAVAFRMMPRENWEVYLVEVGSGASIRLTHDIQHDLFPRFVAGGDGRVSPANAILVIKGEGRHRRSFLYDGDTGDYVRLFHNNTLRTVSPEYQWSVSPDGSRIAIVAERDGDTISPERSLHLVRLDQTLTAEEVLQRIASQRETELGLRTRGEAMFQPVAEEIAELVARVSRHRIYGYESDLFEFDSKFITQPGNAKAIEYLVDRLRSFGYEPELQWFEPRPGIRSANVIATLAGTADRDLTYVVSSHFDSVERGPGADDNTSGTAALLEAARVLSDRPRAATVKFAFFTGEEAGLRGSREFVRRAIADGDQIVGALNNDMIGYANDSRLDNTIRYSNDGIRDLQHAAAFLFTDLVTYDARYYKSTDAHAYYEAYGDIVGGIGSYPILANPHYHQSHDVLETINHQLVAEVSKTTVASVMLLADSPSRLTGLEASRQGDEVHITWDRARESDVAGYLVAYGPPGYPGQSREISANEITLTDLEPGVVVAVKAINARGLAGWDWARIQVE